MEWMFSGDTISESDQVSQEWVTVSRGETIMKMQQVRTLAKRLGVNSFGKSKSDLIREIQRKEGNFDCYGSSEGYCDQMDCAFRSACVNEDKSSSRSESKPDATRM